MIKVFLVEDEFAIRESIKKTVSWEKEGFELVGEAGDGEMAYPKILDSRPQILITDIRMPFMDGLELAALVKKDLPKIKILVLSGYDDFEYAKKAISIGVEEYLLKPVTEEALVAELKKIAGIIEKEESEIREREKVRAEWEERQAREQEKMIDSIRSSYSEALQAFEEKMRKNTSQYLVGAADEDFDFTQMDIGKLERRYVCDFLKQGSEEEVEAFVREQIESLGQYGIGSLMMRQYMMTGTVFTLITFLSELGYQRQDIEQGFGDFREVAANSASLESMETCMVDLFKKAIHLRNSKGERRYLAIIDEAKKYMQLNLSSEELSLPLVAEQVGVSPNHFSAIFRQESGETFIEYLTRIRMEKARELLICSALRTSDVGFEVGYRDPHYFSYVFKKTQGMTPKEYRKVKRKGEPKS